MKSILRVEPCHERLKKAMRIRDMRAVEISNATGISESALSHYITGRYEPKQDRLVKIAEALNVRPEYLMGLDVPMELEDFAEQKRNYRIQMFATIFNDLSEEDQDFIFRQIQLLRKAKDESNEITEW